MQNLIGSLAGVLTTLSFVPQVMRVWKTHSTKDISLSMYVVFMMGLALWLVYGVNVGSWPIILFNALTFLLALSVLVAKLKFDSNGDAL